MRPKCFEISITKYRKDICWCLAYNDKTNISVFIDFEDLLVNNRSQLQQQIFLNVPQLKKC